MHEMILTDGPCKGRVIKSMRFQQMLLVPVDENATAPSGYSPDSADTIDVAEYGHVGGNLFVFNRLVAR